MNQLKTAFLIQFPKGFRCRTEYQHLLISKKFILVCIESPGIGAASKMHLIPSGGNEMGRRRLEANPPQIYDLALQGKTQRQTAKELGICPITLARRMDEIQAKEGLLLKYRSLQTFQLTELQLRVLEAITPEKIADASALDLAKAFKFLKKAELGLKGEPFRITGLPGIFCNWKGKKQTRMQAPRRLSPDDCSSTVRGP